MALEPPQASHRPGNLKQTNNGHKHGKHRSKGSISSLNKGRVSVKALSKRHKKELNRDERRHQSMQVRRTKRDEILAKKRSLGGFESAPFLVCIIPLNESVAVSSTLDLIKSCDPELITRESKAEVTHIAMPRFRQRFSFVTPADDIFAIMDAAKVSDTILFVTSALVADPDELISDWGREVLQATIGQGLPSTCTALMDLETIPIKKRNDFKQFAQKMIGKYLPNEKVMNLETPVDGLNLLRKIGSQKLRSITYRERRPYLFAESYEYVANDAKTGTLKVSGYLKGACLSVNSLVHIPGFGDFQMALIEAPKDPFTVEKHKSRDVEMMELDATRVVAVACPEQQESLVAENEPDMMDGEQTWPTRDELDEAEASFKAKTVKRVPKGCSDYQAAWIPDDGDDDVEDDDEDESEMDAQSGSGSESENEESRSVMESEIGVNDEKYDEEMDAPEERQALVRFKKQALEDAQFPDEVDTPQDQPARERFVKYRGLESFRTSPWDVKENLPLDYARIFQFENFDRTKKRVLKEQEDVDGAIPGWFVTVHVINVDAHLWHSFNAYKNQLAKWPLVLFGLLPHEHKLSVLNVVLKRTAQNDEPIKSKTNLIFQCGFRRFTVAPIFSQHTNATKHKFERFFQANSTIVATFFAPIQYPPSPVLCFKKCNDNLEMIASGSVLSVNPDRLIVKRVVLSGHLFKVHKRSAIVRFMFFNRDDINYFKPCKLRTKMGRHGHIKEPLGTHGHMKCIFDGQVKSQDTVLLNLYKRVFPKWNFRELTLEC